MLIAAAGFSERLLHDKRLLQVCNKSNINKKGEEVAPQEPHSLYTFPSECIFSDSVYFDFKYNKRGFPKEALSVTRRSTSIL